MTVTVPHFRDLLANLPTAVTVVTSAVDGEPYGATCSAVCSVSAEPPQLLVCLARTSRTARCVASAGVFAVNVLRRGRGDLAARFAGPAAERFAGLALRSVHGAPVLPDDDLVAWTVCRVRQVVPSGTHDLVVGEVLEGGTVAAAPLLYFQRGYRALDLPEREAPCPSGP